MIVDQPVTNPSAALFHVGMLEQMRSADPRANMDAILSADLGTPVNSGFLSPTGVNLAVYVGGNTTRRIMYIDGVRTKAQSDALMEGYGTITGLPAVVENNIYIQQQVVNIVERLTIEFFSLSEHFDFVGYSAGGAVAVAMIDRIRFQPTYPKTKCITFGAPRTGHASLADRLGNTPVARWMTGTDPIPLLPLRVLDSPFISALIDLGRLISWQQFTHVAGGISFDAAGNTTPSILPTAAAVSPVSSLFNWVWSVEGDPSNPHSLVTYRNWLTAAASQTNFPAAQQADEGPAETVNPVRTREVNRQRERVQGEIANAAAFQNAGPQVTPEATLFKAFRQGRIWYVALGNQICLTAGPEKRARHIARAGNDFLRSLQKQAVVDPASLLSQLQVFMELAADPNSGFQPTINTQVPQ